MEAQKKSLQISLLFGLNNFENNPKVAHFKSGQNGISGSSDFHLVEVALSD